MADAQFTQNFTLLQKYMDWLEYVDPNGDNPENRSFLKDKLWGSFNENDSSLINNPNAVYYTKSSMWLYKDNAISSTTETRTNTAMILLAQNLGTNGRFIPFQIGKSGTDKALISFYSFSDYNALTISMVRGSTETEVLYLTNTLSVRVPSLTIGNSSTTYFTLSSSGLSSSNCGISAPAVTGTNAVSTPLLYTNSITSNTSGATQITVSKNLHLGDRDILWNGDLGIRWQSGNNLGVGNVSNQTLFKANGTVEFPNRPIMYTSTTTTSKILCSADITLSGTTLTITLP